MIRVSIVYTLFTTDHSIKTVGHHQTKIVENGNFKKCANLVLATPDLVDTYRVVLLLLEAV